MVCISFDFDESIRGLLLKCSYKLHPCYPCEFVAPFFWFAFLLPWEAHPGGGGEVCL